MAASDQMGPSRMKQGCTFLCSFHILHDICRVECEMNTEMCWPRQGSQRCSWRHWASFGWQQRVFISLSIWNASLFELFRLWNVHGNVQGCYRDARSLNPRRHQGHENNTRWHHAMSTSSWLWNIFWLNVETLLKIDRDIMMLGVYNSYSSKSMLHMYLTSCVRSDCFIEYSYDLFMII